MATKSKSISYFKFTKEKIKEIQEASYFKMDPIFVLEFDKKKYYEELNKKK